MLLIRIQKRAETEMSLWQRQQHDSIPGALHCDPAPMQTGCRMLMMPDALQEKDIHMRGALSALMRILMIITICIQICIHMAVVNRLALMKRPRLLTY